MAGILSIGWHLPSQRQSVSQVAAAHGLSERALLEFGLRSKVVPGPTDHPAGLAAEATRAALEAAELSASQIDLLIFVGATRDRPSPWVAAFGVLEQLGASQAAGFDLSCRCPGLGDALWIGANLIKAGTFSTVVVCCGDRFDYLIDPAASPSIADAVYSAGGAAAVLSSRAENEIAARAHFTREDLAGHTTASPIAGGSMAPFDREALEGGTRFIRDQKTVTQVATLRDYFHRAEARNIEAVCRTAGFEEIDFITGSVLNVNDQAESLAALGIGADKHLMMMPRHGHIGAASALVSIGSAIQEGRPVGPRLVMNLRTYVYCNAIAIRGLAADLGIRVSNSTKELA